MLHSTSSLRPTSILTNIKGLDTRLSHSDFLLLGSNYSQMIKDVYIKSTFGVMNGMPCLITRKMTLVWEKMSRYTEKQK